MDGAQGESKNRRTRKVDWKKDGMSMGKKRTGDQGNMGIRKTESGKREAEKNLALSMHGGWHVCGLGVFLSSDCLGA